jgi:DNA-binding response OmpR family regulator
MKTLLETPCDKAANVPTRDQANPPQRILVVDDEPHIRRLSAEVLAFSGYQVVAVEDGAVAWDTLQLNSYDLLVTDHNMPKLTGVDLVKKLHAAHMALPVILVTGAPPTEELKRHPWLQIDATLLKPYTVEELLGTVTKVLRATVNAREQIEPLPNWRSQPSAAGLQLC